MVKGSCMCGQSTYDYNGEYSAFVACHCIPCRKTSGADRSLNLAVPNGSITVTAGSPLKLTTRKADSGQDLVYHQCGNVGQVKSQGRTRVLLIVVGLAGLERISQTDGWKPRTDMEGKSQCGSILFSEPKVAPEVLFLKVGLLDDKEFVDSLGPPKLDVYCKNFWTWEKPIEGAKAAQTT